jgi:dihydrofolate reductase
MQPLVALAFDYRQEMDMTAAPPRPFISAMQVTLDGYSLGSDGNADWVDSWADGLELLPRVDAFVLGAGMFPGYEVFWTAIREDPKAVAEWLGRDPYPREIEYARIAGVTPHLVLSSTLRDTTWPTARVVRELDELRAFKTQPGGPVYVVGGARLVRSLIDEALLDELRLTVHPVVLGTGAPLLSGITRRQDLELIDSDRTTKGRVNLTYRVTARRSDDVE